MSWTRGDFYVCPDPECACEIMIVMAPRQEHESEAPTCCCGKVMHRDGPVLLGRGQAAEVR